MAEIIVKKKRGGVVEPFDKEKIHAAIRKSADRVLLNLTDEDCNKVSDYVINHIKEGEVTVRTLHKIVEVALDETGFPKVAKSYRQYRNYKIDARKIMEAVDAKTLELTYKEDRSNANSDSLLVSTKRSILFGEMQKEKYKRLFLNTEELEAIEKGFIYIHDIKDRLSTMNCNLCNIGRILKDGFTLANLTYTEPKSLSAAMSVTTDIISAYAGQQYGGTTIPQIDEVMIPYAERSYNFYLEQYKNLVEDVGGEYNEDKADQFAYERTKREAEQQYQHMEHSMNSIASSRGDFASNYGRLSEVIC